MNLIKVEYWLEYIGQVTSWSLVVVNTLIQLEATYQFQQPSCHHVVKYSEYVLGWIVQRKIFQNQF